MDIDPRALPPAERYKLLIGTIVPRPIAFVSTCSPDGKLNLAPFSFFCGVGSSPLTLAFCPANTSSGDEKDTLRNCKPVAEGGTGEFVVNIASAAYAAKVAAAGEALPYGESEFELVGLTHEPSAVVRPPRVRESPVSFECRTLQVIRLNPGGPSGSNLVLGEIVHVHAHDGVINERHHVDADLLDAIGRMGGSGYCSTRDRFEMPLGRASLNGGFGPQPR